MIQVAKIGKSVGVRGGVKLHLLTDFPQIFQKVQIFQAQSLGFQTQNLVLKLKHYQNEIAIFEGYESLEKAKELTNLILCVSKEDTYTFCQLQEGEAFWFDAIGCKIIESDEVLGEVLEIERIGNVDYLIIQATQVEDKRAKSFMIPYIDRYILKMDLKNKTIFTRDAKDLWLAS